MVDKRDKQEWEKFVEIEDEPQSKKIQKRIEAISKILVPDDGLVGALRWVIYRVCLVPISSLVAVSVLRVAGRLSWFVYGCLAVPVLGFLVVCVLNWKMNKLWIMLSILLVLIGVGLNWMFMTSLGSISVGTSLLVIMICLLLVGNWAYSK